MFFQKFKIKVGAFFLIAVLSFPFLIFLFKVKDFSFSLAFSTQFFEVLSFYILSSIYQFNFVLGGGGSSCHVRSSFNFSKKELRIYGVDVFSSTFFTSFVDCRRDSFIHLSFFHFLHLDCFHFSWVMFYLIPELYLLF